jgi:hypothetical protein
VLVATAKADVVGPGAPWQRVLRSSGAIIGIEMRGGDPRVLARRHEEVLRLPGSAGRMVRVAGRRGPGRHEPSRDVRSARWGMAPGATMDRP